MRAPVAEDQLVFDLHCLQRRTARKKFRRDILDSWDNKCAYCDSDRAHTLDHVHPKAKGGATRRNNLVACCATCNILKTDIPFMEWFRAQTFWSYEREMRILEWVNKPDSQQTQTGLKTEFFRPILTPVAA